jgi:hypothetical protein
MNQGDIVQVVVSGGTPNYQANSLNPQIAAAHLPSGSNTITIEGLNAGNTTVNVTDSAAAMVTVQVQVMGNSPPPGAPLNVHPNPVTLIQWDSDEIAVNGGNPPYEAHPVDPAIAAVFSAGQNAFTIEGLHPGTTIVNVTDGSSAVPVTVVVRGENPSPQPPPSPGENPPAQPPPSPGPNPQSPSSGGELVNLSTRGYVGTADDVMVGGFSIRNASVTVVVRAVAPSLWDRGVSGALSDPTLELFSGSTLIASNDDWQDSPQADQIPTYLQLSEPMESAILMTLNPGEYTAIVRGFEGEEGIALVEVYKISGAGQLVNLSTRGYVGTGDDVMIAGFSFKGSPMTLVLRAIGPSMTASGVPGCLYNPYLQLFQGSASIDQNNDWQSCPRAAEVTANHLEPSNTLESALVVTLQPGAYTVQVSGVGGEAGIGLSEVFKGFQP